MRKIVKVSVKSTLVAILLIVFLVVLVSAIKGIATHNYHASFTQMVSDSNLRDSSLIERGTLSQFVAGSVLPLLGGSWYGVLICVVVTVVIIYLNIRHIGKLDITFEERQSQVKAFESKLRTLVLILGVLGLVGLLKPVSGLAIVMTLSISEALIGLSRLKFEEYYRKYQDKGIEHGDQ